MNKNLKKNFYFLKSNQNEFFKIIKFKLKKLYLISKIVMIVQFYFTISKLKMQFFKYINKLN